MNKKLKVGFIGLGLMGKPMAKNIQKASFPLAVYNRTKEKTLEFQKSGVLVFNTPKDLSQEVDLIITMITGPKDVKEVLLGKNGVIETTKKELIVVDMSTIGPKAAIEIAKELKKHKIEFLDAPVTGSVVKAESGDLTIFVGGDEIIYRKAKPVLMAMGKNIHYMGLVGNGQAIKLVNNLLVALTVTSLAEGILLSDLLKLPREKVVKALRGVPVISPYLQMKLPNMVKNQFPVAFSLSNMHKDLDLALKEVQKRKKNLPMLKMVEHMYKKGLKMGLSDKDLSSVLLVLSKEFTKSARGRPKK